MKNIIILLLFTLLNSCNGQTKGTIVTESKKRDSANTINPSKSSEKNDGLIYFSLDNGLTWENKSDGLPDTATLGRIAVSDSFLGMTTKENGVFIFDFQKQSWSNISNDEQIIKNNLEELAFQKARFMLVLNMEGFSFRLTKVRVGVHSMLGLGI